MATAQDIEEWEREWRKSRQSRDFLGVCVPALPPRMPLPFCVPCASFAARAALTCVMSCVMVWDVLMSAPVSCVMDGGCDVLMSAPGCQERQGESGWRDSGS